MEEKNLLEKIINWAGSEEVIRLALLTGSFADRSFTDELSDYDISFFCSNTQKLTECDTWVKDIDDVWVMIPEKYGLLEASIPTKLVIFGGGKKADFSFFSVQQLKKLEIDGLPDALNMGYEVLVDKDRLANKLPLPKFEGFRESRPSEEEFHRLIKEFWFEIYHVAKYLRRQDLWSVQFRLSGIHHNFLVKMICWNEASKHNWNYRTNKIGKRMHEWVSEDTWKAVHRVFPHFEAKDGWGALRRTMGLFGRLARETASDLEYSYCTDMERDITNYVQSLETIAVKAIEER